MVGRIATAEIEDLARMRRSVNLPSVKFLVGRDFTLMTRLLPDRLPQLVDGLKSETELIITNSYAAARVVKDRSNFPVVAITGADPVATGLIASLARPGGNITGIGEVAAELSA